MKTHFTRIAKFAVRAILAIPFAASSYAGVLVNLDATSLPNGPLPIWPNAGTLGGNFSKEVDTPTVTTLAGVKGVTLDGSSDWYVGPAAPSQITGNGSRSAIAWIYNPTIEEQETIVAWGRRGGGDGTDAAFLHGTNASYGALGQWGDGPDVGWNSALENGVWTCVAYTYDNSTGTSAVYTNGQLSNSEKNGPLNTFGTSTGGTALPIVVGCQNAANGTRGNANVPASLTIGKLKIHDTALTSFDIISAYNLDAVAFGRPVTTAIGQFLASQSSIDIGGSAMLSWAVSGAVNVSISPAVTIPPGNQSVAVNPTVTTTYQLTATGPNGSATKEVTVIVKLPPSAPTSVAASSTTVPSNAVAGSFIALLASGDANREDTHQYQLVAGPGDANNAFFTISGNQLLAQHAFAGDLGGTFRVRIRSTDSGSLAAEFPLVFTVVPAPATVVINEIHCDPDNNGTTEFIELFNPTSFPISLSGWKFTSGISYAFPSGASIAAGAYVVVAQDSAAFLLEFGFAPSGQFSGKLSGDGELVELRDAANSIVDQVDYRSEFPWPVSAGEGGSMELVNPSLDNNLGGSWRGSASAAIVPEVTFVSTAALGWKWRPGNTEASNPKSAWRASSFVEDGTWSGSVKAPIGYGVVDNLPLNTNIVGMQNNYRCIFARKQFTISPGAVPSMLKLRYTPDDGVFIWINGQLVAQRNIVGTVTEPTISTGASNQSPEGLWYEVNLSNASLFLVEGVNTVAVQLINYTLGSTDLGFDIELKQPAATRNVKPSPGAPNRVYAENPPPQIRQVEHSPQQPTSSQDVTVTAKVSDPQGVGPVQLMYQVVAPGAYIPAKFPRTAQQILANPDGDRLVNAAFEDPANWLTTVMHDDGTGGDVTAADGVFTAVIPAKQHRTLVRYRILASDLPGAQIRVPYLDDESLNFAYFVYNGVPNFAAPIASVDPAGAGKVWPKSLLTSLPVYHWIIRHEDMLTLQAYNSGEQMPNDGTDLTLAARRSADWEGAFVYDGVVYDHIHARLRGGNSRYGDFDGRFPKGKRHYKISFNPGNELQAKNQKGQPYPTKWKKLALNRMFGTKGGNAWGMPEEIGTLLWKSFGVPAQNTHWIHFRVIDDVLEAADQYNGDFWGLTQAVEEYDGSYLEARGMTKGNLYKMSDWIWDAERQRRYQSPDMVRDGSEFNNIRDNLHGGQSAAWLNQYVNYESWYRYSAVVEGIRHYDVFPYTDDVRHALKNQAWYFEPIGSDPTRGVCTFLPYDWDASFGPSFNNGWDHASNAIYGWDRSTETQNNLPYMDKPEMKIAHRNVLREFRDLIWQPDQLNQLIDDRAQVIGEFSKADQDRWRNAPASAGTGNDDPLVTKVQDMKNFCFTGWSGGSGPAVGAGGRGAYLDTLADSADAGVLPYKPTISYTGAASHPINGLVFRSSTFSDPQGLGTFAAMSWRIGEIEDSAAPAYVPADDFKMEANAIWQSGVLPVFNHVMSIPVGAVKPGHTYRARVRMQDNTGHWSHWSAPYQFTTTQPADLADLQANLMVTEIMYNPAGPAPAGGSKEDYEYVELQNISSTLTLDLTNVRFTKGIDFDFAGSAIVSLAPGARVVVVKNLAAFQSRYGFQLPVAGVWDSKDNLSNSGEPLKLSYGAGIAIRDFEYDDIAPWPSEPDGGGPSLQLIDPFSAPDHAVAANWQASAALQGSPGNPDSRYAVWFSQHVSAPTAGAMNPALAYALGADLVASPSAAMPVATLISGHLTLSYRVRTDATDATYLVETSDNLIDWFSDSSAIEPTGTPTDNADGTRTFQARVIDPASADTKRFVRLRVVIDQ